MTAVKAIKQISSCVAVEAFKQISSSKGGFMGSRYIILTDYLWQSFRMNFLRGWHDVHLTTTMEYFIIYEWLFNWIISMNDVM